MLGEELIGPLLMIGATTTAALFLTFAENAPQTHPKPLIEVAEFRPVTMTKVLEPALLLRLQQHAQHAQAVAVATMGQLTQAVGCAHKSWRHTNPKRL